MRTDSVGGIVHFPLHLDGVLAHVLQSKPRRVMKISMIVELDGGSVQVIAGVLLFLF